MSEEQQNSVDQTDLNIFSSTVWNKIIISGFKSIQMNTVEIWQVVLMKG